METVGRLVWPKELMAQQLGSLGEAGWGLWDLGQVGKGMARSGFSLSRL